MTKQGMTDQQLKRHRQAASGLAYTTSTLGLGILGSKIGGKALKKAGKLKKVTDTIDRHGENALATSAGIGGISGYNYAALTREEARRGKLAKSFSDPGIVMMIENMLGTEITKAYDPEKNRHKRSKGYEHAARGAGVVGAATSTGILAGAGVGTAKRAHMRRQKTMVVPKPIMHEGKEIAVGPVKYRAKYTKKKIEGTLKPLRLTRTKGRIAAASGAVGIAGMVGADRIGHYNRRKGRSYRPLPR